MARPTLLKTKCSDCGTTNIDDFPKLRPGSKTRKFAICKACLLKIRYKAKKERAKEDNIHHRMWRLRLEKYGGYDLDGRVN